MREQSRDTLRDTLREGTSTHEAPGGIQVRHLNERNAITSMMKHFMATGDGRSPTTNPYHGIQYLAG